MTTALENVLAVAPAGGDREALWTEAIVQAMRIRPGRKSARGPSPAERLRCMREKLDKELVAFHQKLVVKPHEGRAPEHATGGALWDIAIPLTLFPKRDRGFSRIECIVEFRADGDGDGTIRVLQLEPQERSNILARAEMGGELELTTSASLGLPLPLKGNVAVAEAAGKIYGRVETAKLNYEIRRECVQAEIVQGVGARWRLDDLRDQERVRLEGHQLGVLLEVEPPAPAIHAAGYLKAYSKINWLSHAVGSLWRDFGEAVKAFFQGGAPTETYGQWQDILR